MVKDQNKEIGELQTWHKQWYASAAKNPMAYDAKMGRMMEMSNDQMNGKMMSQDLGKSMLTSINLKNQIGD
ncbi:MAG: hypothetical protein DCF19_15615 [Pseudanabaena frigida]|uniref:Uncharacterized protein n=1 Tax=Pseudanabaena frigida TaxID=945775 RepID=A0A2W4W2T8_9CYAN|nr:MAG: hypothetical protein DCF19_15615 [Pseudanabaena frigida]